MDVGYWSGEQKIQATDLSSAYEWLYSVFGQLLGLIIPHLELKETIKMLYWESYIVLDEMGMTDALSFTIKKPEKLVCSKHAKLAVSILKKLAPGPITSNGLMSTYRCGYMTDTCPGYSWKLYHGYSGLRCFGCLKYAFVETHFRCNSWYKTMNMLQLHSLRDNLERCLEVRGTCVDHAFSTAYVELLDRESR